MKLDFNHEVLRTRHEASSGYSYGYVLHPPLRAFLRSRRLRAALRNATGERGWPWRGLR